MAGARNGSVRVIQYGIGAMGGNMVRLLQDRNATIVGGIDIDPSKIGRDIGEVVGLGRSLGVRVLFPAEEVLDKVKADIVLHATTAHMSHAFPQLMAAIDRGLNVISIAQELFFPLPENQEKANLLDRKAKEKGVRVLSTGVNPGFVMDVVPVLMSSICWQVTGVEVRRIVDFSPYGPDEMRHIGAGLSKEEFQAGVASGAIGHIGLKETCAFIAHSLGIDLEELKQTKEPMITRIPRKTGFAQISPGRVYGFKQSVCGYRKGQKLISLSMIGMLDPRPEDGMRLGDYTFLQGTPNVEVEIRREVSHKGGLATSAMAVNMIPQVLAAPPGFLTMKDLSLPSIWPHELLPS